MKLLATTAALAVSLAMPAWAADEAKCAPTRAFAQYLQVKFGERPVERMQTNFNGDDVIFIVSADANHRTWSFLRVHPDQGMMCLVAEGSGRAPTLKEIMGEAL